MIFEAAFFPALLAGLWAGFRSDLRNPTGRVPFRFGGYAAVPALLAHSALRWSADPLAPRLLVSWGLILAAAAALSAGRSALLNRGAPAKGIDSATRLVTTGICRWIRHPLHLAAMPIAAACALKQPDAASLILALLCAALLLITATAEGRQDFARFGPPYAEYVRSSKRFVPYLF
jgi:protein-S-isoprenylcysteine O-methyltransferase Ste14